MKKFLKYTGVYLKAFPHFAAFELLFKLIMVAIGAPVLAFMLKWTMKMSGISYLSDENILSYIKSPYTIIVFLTMLLCSAFFSFVDLSALAACFSCYMKKERIGSMDMLRTGLSAFIRAFRGMGILEFVKFAFCISLAQFTLSSGVFLAPLMPILRTIFRSLSGVSAMIAFIMVQVLFVTLIISSCYSIHFLILTDNSFHKCVKKSKSIIAHEKLKMILSSLEWLVAVLFFIALITFGLSFIIVFIIKGGTHPSYAFRTAVKVLKYAGRVFLAVYVFFSAPAVMCWLTAKFYKDINGNEEITLPKRCRQKTGKLRNFMAVCILIVIGLGVNFTYLMGIYKGNISLNTGIFSRVQVSAHRGASKTAPENTIPAFEQAVESGADYIELDVQLTKDGRLIVLHDDKIDRTTDGKGMASELTYDEIQQYSAGKWFDKEGTYSDVKVPEFREVLDAVGGDILLNIEIKNHGDINRTAEMVVELIDEYELRKSCYVTSFSYKALKKVKELDPKIKTALISHIAPSTVYSQMKYIDAVSMNYLFVNQSVVNYAHRSGKRVFVWTVDRTADMQKMVSLGVDNIITNCPEKAVEVVDSDSVGETVITVLRYFFGQ